MSPVLSLIPLQGLLKSFQQSQAAFVLPRRSSVSEKLSALARLYVDIGSMNAADFRGHIEALWVSESSRYINFLEYLLDVHHGQPELLG